MTCPNCGQETPTTHCLWCHYPVFEDREIERKGMVPKSGNAVWKLLGHIVSAILALAIIGFAFVHFSPDYSTYVVRSGSMTPAINTGDIIVTGSADGLLNSEIKSGTIVTYKHGKELITHRVQSIDGDRKLSRYWQE